MIVTDKVKELFKIARTKCGAPIRSVQITDDQMCDLLKVAIGDYAEYVQNWVLESQWLNLQGNQQMLKNPAEAAYAMTVRTMDWSRDYSYWFSREVGLQQRGPYELKKDFFKIELGKQVYVVPAGREINKVLYITPSTTKAALYGTYGSFDAGFAGGFGQFGDVNHPMGMLGMYVGNVYDVALQAADLKYKNSLIRGDLAYQVTAGPNGTHLIHLLSVPGGRNSMGGIAADDSWGWSQFKDCYCWYTYYDVAGMDESGVTQCMIDNKDDVLITPDQVPMDQMQYELMNNPTQQIIRQLFVAEVMITLGVIRGYASGEVKIPQAEMKLDYSMLLDLGKQEKERVFTRLKERLEEMLPWNQLKHQADLTDSLMKVLQQKPMPFTFIVR